MPLPPIPTYLTISDAVEAMAENTEKKWSASKLLGCAERYELSVFAKLSKPAKFIRIKPIEGRTNEIVFETGSFARIDTDAIRSLLLIGEANITGWEELKKDNSFGCEMEVWVKEFEISKTDSPRLVGIDDCRLTGTGISQLIEKYAPNKIEEKKEVFNKIETQTPIQQINVEATPSEWNGKTKRAKQIEAILQEIKSMELKPMEIPTGMKTKICKRCQEKYSDLFGAGIDPFKEAWQMGLDEMKFRLKEHDKFTR